MELHEIQGARSLPNVVLIKLLFLKITTNSNYLISTLQTVFSRALHAWKKAICSHGTETNPSEHKMKCFLMDSPLWSQDVIDNMIAYITLCNPNDDCLEWSNSLSFCQEDEPASDEFCSIIRLSIQFILDELSVWDRQLVSSIKAFRWLLIPLQAMFLVVHDTYSSDCESITNQSSNLSCARYYN